MSAFQLSNETVAGFELRPWTLTTQTAIEFLSDKQLTDVEQAIAMVYIQGETPKSIRQSIQDETLLDKIKDFIDHFPLYNVLAISGWCKRQMDLINVNRVEVLPRSEPDPKTPPNL